MNESVEFSYDFLVSVLTDLIAREQGPAVFAALDTLYAAARDSNLDSVSPQQNSDDSGNQPCGRCGKPQGSTLTEHVDGRGPGWKCDCGWWTWLTGNKADYSGSVMTALPAVFQRKLEHLKAERL